MSRRVASANPAQVVKPYACEREIVSCRRRERLSDVVLVMGIEAVGRLEARRSSN
jgi:hypothetical protein